MRHYASLRLLAILPVSGFLLQVTAHPQTAPIYAVETTPALIPPTLSLNPSIGPSASATVVPQDFQQPYLRADNGTFGPDIEIVHYFNDQWPNYIAISREGRIFTAYATPGNAYTLGEVSNLTGEIPYPSMEFNTPPEGKTVELAGYVWGTNDSSHLLNVEAIYFDDEGYLWVLDTGRPYNEEGVEGLAQVGGPKLLKMDISNDSVVDTYRFKSSCVFPDSFLADVRFDFRPEITKSGKGVAYIADTSASGRPGFVILDLGTRACHRRLSLHPSVQATYASVPTYNGFPFYVRGPKSAQIRTYPEGVHGMALSADGATLYYSPFSSPNLYSVPTELMRTPPDEDNYADYRAGNAVQNLGGVGGLRSGFDSDSNGLVYMGAPEVNGIITYSSAPGANPVAELFVRDPRLQWVDTPVLGYDGWLYGDATQLFDEANENNGTEYRAHPGFMFRVKTPSSGTKQIMR